MTETIAVDGEISITLYVESDASILCEADHDPEHRKRFDFPVDFVPSVEHARYVIAVWAKEREAGRRFAFAVRKTGTGELLGGCELRPLGNGRANVSYWVHPRHRRKGVASSAVRLLSRKVAPAYGFVTLELLTEADNLASRGVARNCDFTESGTRDGLILHLHSL
jgi:RimJ/RimL family protein N-acetyltransferase